ncbi:MULTISPECIES: hypothetical protein [Bacillus cereus group]|uniref:CopG family transcriptional regulator n=3 Tax=Bacillus thuringiensis TaxID=1428 RepID=A0A1W6WYG9_BACTU|nr:MULTISPECIES: hypothetical protein [Bacillus cereus group]MEB8823581.1 CopG family transcriptional regulator [Bacillus cereus]AGG04850.1 hypothetical protein H175_107p126 [Bacillus thuringiensis serovar thuringiensis str. IS5056]ARP61625.1 CopG family transcriptional regulator [Bacillus thuringiensis]AST05282.1 CopG family transcriptional regulator [Bacillus thuringiensis]EEM35187.1 hypothetical protein bthur0003_22370 [Bacillus thuringiensis serovar thuringiensis str. T01001]
MNLHGGKREGAGRPSMGVTKKISVTLPEEVWDLIDQECEDKNKKRAQIFRETLLKKYIK